MRVHRPWCRGRIQPAGKPGWVSDQLALPHLPALKMSFCSNVASGCLTHIASTTATAP